MFKLACKECETEEQEGQLADLLTRYEAVFSKNDQDIGRTELVYHSIPTTKGTRPIRQPPHRLGPHKEQEAKRQVQDLLARGMIEPAHGAWSLGLGLESWYAKSPGLVLFAYQDYR